MAWRCSGATNLELVSNLRSSGIIKSPSVFNAMVAIDRKNFVDKGPYQDSPQLLMKGQTISAPHMHAHALDVLANEVLRENASVLDVGIGSGYLSAAFCRLNPSAQCTGIDIVPELVTLARENILKKDADLLETGRLTIPEACNGWRGYPENSPYDAIHVGAAASELPFDLLCQLKVGGKMVIPLGPEGGDQVLMQVVRKREHEKVEEGEEQEFEVTNLMGVRYVPLVSDVS